MTSFDFYPRFRFACRRAITPSLLASVGAATTFSCAAVAPAQAADTIFFQRNGVLYAVNDNDEESLSAPPRRLTLLTRDTGTLWDVSPDGRRIAWLVRPAATIATSKGAKTSDLAADGGGRGMNARPATLFVGDRTGRRQKKLLSTDALHDRQGRKVTRLSAAAPGSADAEPLPGGFESWEPVGICYSADGKTLYLSCVSSAPAASVIVPIAASDGAIPAVPAAPQPPTTLVTSPAAPNRATFAVDAATGAAIVDAQGRWKSFAPITDLDAAGTLLAGLGRQTPRATGTSDGGASSAVAPAPLTVVNLAEGKVVTLSAPRPAGTPAPPPIWTSPSAPAIAPNGARLAFVSANARKGLWLCDPSGKTYRRLLSGDVARPRWAANGARIYYLAPRPGATDRSTLDLYVVDAPATLAPPPASGGARVAAPRIVLQNVEWFDIAAD